MLERGRPPEPIPSAPARPELVATRRSLILAPLLGAFPALLAESAQAGTINAAETQVTTPDAIQWSSWLPGFPPDSAQMATLYGSLDKPGPYVVLMKWYPGFMSAPHTYATDRLSVVVSGVWWVTAAPTSAQQTQCLSQRDRSSDASHGRRTTMVSSPAASSPRSLRYSASARSTSSWSPLTSPLGARCPEYGLAPVPTMSATSLLSGEKKP
jgi:hypothetical protein